MPDPDSSQWKRFVRLRRPTVRYVSGRARRLEGATIRHAHRYVISRLTNLRDVRRHALGWLVLAALVVIATGLQLSWSQGAHSAVSPVSGGVYAEGVIGRLDTLNPIYTSTQSERSASYLVFSSLLHYDRANNLSGDLAQSWQASADGKTYTVALRQNARWHDGQPVTAQDVVFTLGLIKNPQTRSYLYRTWQGVTVKATSDFELAFTLPSAYAPFPHALTFGILPEHILRDVSPLRLRENAFNREPIGSGPFKFVSTQIINPDTERVVLQLDKNPAYYGRPVRVDRFQLHTYQDHDALRKGFLTREVNAAAELTTSDIRTISEQLPATHVNSAPLYDGVYAFFKTDMTPVLSDVAVRRALVKATDRTAVRKALDGSASNLEGPLVPEQLAGIGDFKQAAFDAKAAAGDLETAGWKAGNDGVRQKDGQRLQLTVVAPRTGEFPEVLEQLAKQWRSIGVDVRTQVVPTNTFEQNILTRRAYDVLLYEIALGADPDVFAYWHSTQASVRGFNLSNYRSGVADDALVSARGRGQVDLRTARYRTFFKTWLEDAPAVALYRPHLGYVTTDNTNAVNATNPVIDTLGRYHTLDQWTVSTDRLFKTP